MTHIKRQNMNKFLPLPKKGTKYLVVPSHSKSEGVPILIVMRDILGFVRTRKELNKIINEKKIIVNGKIVNDDKLTLLLFDKLSLKDLNKFYRVSIGENKKILLEEIKESEIDKKVSKITGKKILKGNKIQVNLSDGRNILTNEKVKMGDSVLINVKSNKIEKIIPIKEKSKVLIIKGKHIGKSGEIKSIIEKDVILSSKEGEIKIKEGDMIVVE